MTASRSRTPPGEVVEVSSIALMPGKKVAIATRRGDVWVCEGAYEDDVTKVKWTKFASNLHEPLGMFYKDKSLFLTQRPEHTRLTDTDGDGKADAFDTICAKWGHQRRLPMSTPSAPIPTRTATSGSCSA